MMTLLGGPAAGSYAVHRAPYYLRAVVATDGKIDVLNELDDSPSKTERVYVYRCIGPVGNVHINRGRKGSGFYILGTWEHMPDVDGEVLRDTEAWRAWCLGNEAQQMAKDAGAILYNPIDPPAATL